jgi:protein-tyrosine phosphatase
MFDLHCHILPGVDDGARTMEDALEMAMVAAANGTRVIWATPHRKDITEGFSISYVMDLLAELNAELDRRGVDLRLLSGMENHLDLELPDEIANGRALRLNDSRYALVEMPFFGSPNYLEEVLFQVQVHGVTPVLAHPERIESVQNDPSLLARLVERGMLSQVTAGSIVGLFGGRVKRLTHNLLRSGLIHVIASDAHFPDGPRSPKLPSGVEAAAAIVGEEKARAMVVDTPKAIMDDDLVYVEPPGPYEEERLRWRPWRRGASEG